MKIKNIIKEIVCFGIVLMIGYSIKYEIQRQYPELEKEVASWIWRF